MTTLTSEQQQPSPDGGGSFLDVRDLKVHFPTDDGIVKSVDGLSFHVERGKTLGIVGESGSGKSVTSMSVMGLHSKNAQISGSIRLDGQELVGASEETVRRLRGKKMAMIFQDPMTSLNPTLTIGLQLTETMRRHLGYSQSEARARAIVKAATYFNDPVKLLEASEELGIGMAGIDISKLQESELMQTRGW